MSIIIQLLQHITEMVFKHLASHKMSGLVLEKARKSWKVFERISYRFVQMVM